ncbi:MAG: helix-turn-helix domain-containing protein [Patescibacteria group bacterium]|jgi:sugar-specific transcriptional regulator TrmB
MYTELLQKLGLSENEAKMYELLLIKGESKAVDLVPESGLGRGNVYNVLTALVGKGLISVTAGKQQIYRATEPNKLISLVEAKKREIDRLGAEFKEELPKLNSTFNLTTGRPAIQVFEGLDGFEQALDDSLTARGEILTYFDPASIVGPIAEINARYVAKRKKKGIPKRIILPDNEAAKAYMRSMGGESTDIALVPGFVSGFRTAMELYDNKVAFLTLTPEKIISVIIEDANIANLQRAQFEFIWKSVSHAAASTSSALAGTGISGSIAK